VKLATFRLDERTEVGAVVGDEIADLGAAGGPPTMIDLLAQHDWRENVQALLPHAPRIPIDSVHLNAPVQPAKYLAIGLNSRDHRREVNVRWLLREPRLLRIAAGYALAHPRPREPFFFAKATSSVSGPRDPIWLPPHTRRVDWEGELAAVIATPIRDANLARARTAIAGYTVANDVTVRDWQTDNPTSAAVAKGYQTHGPLGPWLRTSDEVDPDELTLRTFLNGELRQHGLIRDLIRSPAEIVSRLSRFCTLLPGDVIACGTFAGTGWPSGRFLRPGDRVRVEIDGIGALDNPVVTAPARHGLAERRSDNVTSR
jgi:2-keto-4-pentenoate hydratase/2-oxohepta-3-ene-1,7-dioic acid hydratase in catechol pathway